MFQPDPWWAYLWLPLKWYVLLPLWRGLQWLWRKLGR